MPYKITSWNGDTGQAEHFADARDAVEAMAEEYSECWDYLSWATPTPTVTTAVLIADHEPTDCWWQIEEV